MRRNLYNSIVDCHIYYDHSAQYSGYHSDYSYDSLSRLLTADYDNGTTVYNYGYDEAGNMVDMNGTTRTYNAANQMTNDGTNTLTYDNNGNLTNDGVNSYTWDRANRLLSHGGISYAYDGTGNRISQDTLKYLLDVQPGLTVVLGDSDGNHFLHAIRGIHAQEDNLGNWEYMAQDGLGSVRAKIDNVAAIQQTHEYDSYGNYIGTAPSGSYFGFTGEQTDGNRQVYLRARYYNPSMGIFPSLDSNEGRTSTPMSLNGYSYVHGNPIMNTDPTGMTCQCDGKTGLDYVLCVANPFNWHFGGDSTATPEPTSTPENNPCGSDIECLALALGIFQEAQGLNCSEKLIVAYAMTNRIRNSAYGPDSYAIQLNSVQLADGVLEQADGTPYVGETINSSNRNENIIAASNFFRDTSVQYQTAEQDAWNFLFGSPSCSAPEGAEHTLEYVHNRSAPIPRQDGTQYTAVDDAAFVVQQIQCRGQEWVEQQITSEGIQPVFQPEGTNTMIVGSHGQAVYINMNWTPINGGAGYQPFCN